MTADLLDAGYAGERDNEVPPTRSIEYRHALKDMGVPARLVIYPDEGRGIRLPDHAAGRRSGSAAISARSSNAPTILSSGPGIMPKSR